MQLFPWSLYSQTVQKKILEPKNGGMFTQEQAEARQLHLAKARVEKTPNILALYWLVDPSDGTILDMKYQLFGHTALIAAAELAALTLVGLNYDQAMRLSSEVLFQKAQDRSKRSLPPQALHHVQMVLEAVVQASHECFEIPLSTTYRAPPVHRTDTVYEDGFPGFVSMSPEEQLVLIEQVLDQDIRPYIAMDAGGVEVVGFEQGHILKISYQGACTSCASSTGATLSYIQQVLKAKVHPCLEVHPL